MAKGVYLLGTSTFGEKMCAAAGRISTQPGNALGIWEKSGDSEKNASLIDKVTRSGHNSTVEHIAFHLAFNDVSVIVEQFMIEFRLASFTVKSRRYVDFSDAGYYTTDFKDPDLKNRYDRQITSLFALYSRLTDAGVPKEDARFVLPYCFLSNFFCTLNGREMLHVLHAMLHGRGSRLPEIRRLGEQLFSQVTEKAPGLVTGFDERKPKGPDGYDLSFLEKRKLREDEKEEPVSLISLTPDASRVICETALLEQGGFMRGDIEKAVADPESRKRIISAVLSSSRPRALESVSCTFAIRGITLSTLTHFARHRVHSIQIPSLDTVDRGSFVTPESIKKDPVLRSEYEKAFSDSRELYESLCSTKEDEAARYVLLSGNTIDIVSTMNGRELLLFFKLRTCSRAQWEIRDYAEKMLLELRARVPEVFTRFGPSCYVEGICPEGRLSCGKAKEIRERYAAPDCCGKS